MNGGPSHPGASAPLAVDTAHALPTDLDIKVLDRARDEQHFDCIVTSPWVDGFKEEREDKWTLDRKAGELVGSFMQEFTAKGVAPESRLMSLEGAGVLLWEIAPDRFKEAWAELVKLGRPPEAIQITSEEKHIPWELMIPPNDGSDQRPLGVRCSIARWFDDVPLRAPGVPVADARVVAPKHNRPPTPLPNAEAEAEFVSKTFGGRKINPAVPSQLKSDLRAWTGGLLHFVCHGKAGTTQVLLLDGPENLTSTQVEGMALRNAWSKSAPVVFLNACEVGRAAPALSGAGGLVNSWARAGAGAVVAPLWSVRDEVAHAIARDFYGRVVKEPNTTYARILRDIRAKAYDENAGEDTYAAYCYFGSPYASASDDLARVAAPAA